MQTRVLLPTADNIKYAASLLKKGEIVGMPTETVYGLAANAYDVSAVEKIFIAKGRPQDNPLIVHISDVAMLKDLIVEMPPIAKKLAEKFWPGPLTMIFKKSDKVSFTVTANLDTVAVRFPSSKTAKALIEAANVPLAAPSANLSGSPSPSQASHVYDDLNGRIPAIIDGGECEVGLESTVIIPHNDDSITLLRPGAITVEMLQELSNNVIVDNGVLHEVAPGQAVLSPGMKHTHYSPKANLFIVDSSFDDFLNLVNSKKEESIGVMVFEDEKKFFYVPAVCFGNEKES
ncbi:MAG: L-threonylcarbamoyladenylate synthase, partial [Oscillospiraceae bacterium]